MNDSLPGLPSLPLSVHWLRFTLRAEEEIHFNSFKGSALRGALTGALTRQYCPEWQHGAGDPLHRRLCPICRLLSWEHQDIEGGDVRRPYALMPPLDDRTLYAAGDTFTFTLSLIGDTHDLMPYLILGVGAMGDSGVGKPDRRGKRGRFSVAAIHAHHPLTGATRALLGPDGQQVALTTLPVTDADVRDAAATLLAQIAPDNKLCVRLHTPLRLNQEQKLVKAPAFFPLAKQIALRLLDLCAQHGSGRPGVRLKEHLYPAADQVRLVADRTRWEELTGFSQRIGRAQQLGGLMGEAVYHTEDWAPLLPWLVWGQLVQVGKNTVKGCGIYTLAPA